MTSEENCKAVKAMTNAFVLIVDPQCASAKILKEQVHTVATRFVVRFQALEVLREMRLDWFAPTSITVDAAIRVCEKGMRWMRALEPLRK